VYIADRNNPMVIATPISTTRITARIEPSTIAAIMKATRDDARSSAVSPAFTRPNLVSGRTAGRVC